MVTNPSNKLAVGLSECEQYIMYPYPHDVTCRLYDDYLETRSSHEITKEEFDKWMKVYNNLLKDFDKFNEHCKQVLTKQGFYKI